MTAVRLLWILIVGGIVAALAIGLVRDVLQAAEEGVRSFGSTIA